MAKRLRMTTADYVVIAISPALIMTLVGSLVFFLIEVFYAGDYQLRLNYAFALFVFAAVLIARIAIEIGSERAALFGLPLGLAMFAVLAKFVEHPSPLSHLINLALLAVVWWCAHQLTWDSTVIDDNQDASGAGLLDRVSGVGRQVSGSDDRHPTPDTRHPAPHTPGIWVLYFSLAALPLFGIGQAWVPASEVGRRRYVLALLLVYVFSALALLVTTSFLGLRRYLRQRNIEMPAPMAGNWIGVGAAITAAVMLLALLLPRPAAEVAVSQPPWQAGSPQGLTTSRHAIGRDGAQQPQPGSAVSESTEAPAGDAVDPDRPSQTADEEGVLTDDADTSETRPGDRSGDSRTNGRDSPPTPSTTDPSAGGPDQSAEAEDSISGAQESDSAQADGTAGNQLLKHPEATNPLRLPQELFTSLGGLAGVLKLLLYAVLAVLAALFLWKNRRQLFQALADIVRAIRDLLARLFGGGALAVEAHGNSASNTSRRRTFADFRDPFAAGLDQRMPPEELVRYTFEAFEAWAADHGSPRTPDQTPMELLGSAVAPQTPFYDEARRLVRLYGQVAYASARVPRDAAQRLAGVWRFMR